MIQAAEASDPALLRLLKGHPRVAAATAGGGPGVRFSQGSWRREILVGDPDCEVAGLPELMDNNPLVCADVASVPDPGSTLALLALGPLAQAGILLEPPVLLCNAESEKSVVDKFLSRLGWYKGALLEQQSLELGGAFAATAIASIGTPERDSDLDELYEEAYGRSFYVRRDDDSPWDVALVVGRPHAVYRLGLTAGEDTSLLTVQVMADKDGKCGAAQIVHAMNVMAGFEETLGIS